MKKSKNILILISIVILVAPILTYLICIILKIIINNNYVDFFIIGSIDAWINFAGTIISGCITMLALYYTLNHEQKNREENEILQIRPCLIGEPIYEPNTENAIKTIKVENCINNYGQIQWKLINFSNNVAKDVKIIKESFMYFDSNVNSFIECSNGLLDNKFSVFTPIINENELLKGQGEIIYRTNFEVSYINNKFPFNSCFIFKQKVIYEYCDLRDMRKYKDVFELTININIDINGQLIFFVEDVKNYSYRK